ncbi:MAG: ROK family protein [Paenibacillaceae bacterium]
MNTKSQVKNTRELRSFNRKQIISLMRTGESMAKSDIAKLMDLSFATTSSICNELIEEGIFTQSKKSSPSGGRPSELLELYALSKVSFCIDFTYKQEVRMSLGDLQNKLIAEQRQSISSNDTLEKIMGNCLGGYAELLESASVSEQQVIGICVIVPGMLDQQKGRVINSTLRILNNMHLESLIRMTMNNTSLPIYIENDANLAALAIATQGGLKKYSQALLLYIGEGIGLGIIQAGGIFRGERGYAGEIAHIPLGNPDILCYCGNKGCIENDLSNSGIQREMKQSANAPITLGTTLGKLISVLGNLLDPEIIFIGGDQEDVLMSMLAHAREEAVRRIILEGSRNIQIQLAPNIHDLFFEGASELIIQKWLSN